MSTFEITYRGEWDGNWLSVVAVVSTVIDIEGLQSSLVLGPVRVITEKSARVRLLNEGYVVSGKIERGRPFEVERVS